MSEISGFLSGTTWESWKQLPIAGDASRRQYRRLTSPAGETAILMIAPPEAGEDLRPFLAIANRLRKIGLCPPEIYLSDTAIGLAVIEDLGPRHFADWLAKGDADEMTLYSAAVDCLRVLANDPAPTNIPVMTPREGAAMVNLYSEWFAPEASELAIERTMYQALATLPPAWPVMSLRDFHAENLIWRPDRSGTDRVGLLDFQDAFVAHPLYDLVSLLRDARRDVSPATVEALTDTVDKTAFATIAAQRNLRILGIFARLIRRDGKDKYAAFIPRVVRALRQDLTHPHLLDLSQLILPDLPDAS